MNTIIATYKRNYRSMKQAVPISSILGNILSGLYMVIFSYLIFKFMFGGKLDESFYEYTQSYDYITYIILGNSVYVLAVSLLMIVSRSLVSELRQGSLEAILLTPSNRINYFLGCFLHGLFIVLIEFVGILLGGLFFGLDLSNINIFGLIIVLVLILFSFFSQAILLGAIMVWFRETYIIQNTLFVSMAFLSGVSFPIEYLPYPIQIISNILPLTHSLNAFRDVVIHGHSISSSISNLGSLLIIGFLYLSLGMLLLKKVENKIIELIGE
ncbi:ABC transporter permease [Bacillus salitolerans]|uniref:Transport permease protein n=1 Tax=Bacillus salitolerans TaxID=1437434 RepID=A0ABW4LMW8_9BACI